MKFEGELKFSVDIESGTVTSELEYEPAEVDELTVLALLGTHLEYRADLLKEQGADPVRFDNQLTVLFGDGEDDESDSTD